MWHERGRSAGEVLGDIEKEVSALEEVVTGEVEGKRSAARLTVDRRKAEYNASERELEALSGDLKTAREELSETETERKDATSLFSIPKGVLYLTLAILLLLADVSLLGQVAASFFGYPWRTRVDGDYITFSKQLFTNPGTALAEFPDLLWLTLAILLMSLFAKLWRDVWDLYDTKEKRWRRFGKFEFIGYTILLFFALSAIGLMSAARYFVVNVQTTEDVPQVFVKIVGSSLGFILPFVSFGFFVKGYDALASRYWLARSRISVWWYERRLRKKKSEVDKKRSRLEAAQRELAEVETPSYIRRAVEEQRRKFLSGYREGVREILGSAGRGSSLVKNLRPVLVERVLQSWSK